MHITKSEIQSLEKIKRLNLINSITGIKPANLIGTIDENSNTNLAIFSSTLHLGSNPAFIGIVVRPANEVRRHTYENIKANKSFTINHVPTNLAINAHYTSAKFTKEESEFEHCKFTEEYIENFAAPFVKESKVKIWLKLEDEIKIKVNGTILLIGSVEHIILPEEILENENQINLEKANSAGISGLNCYYAFNFLQELPYARKSELPEFRK